MGAERGGHVNTTTISRAALVLCALTLGVSQANPMSWGVTWDSGGGCDVTPPLDAHDRVLNVHYLDDGFPEFEADSQISPFWHIFAAADSVHLYPTAFTFDGSPTPTSASDASVVMRAVGNDYRLYLLVIVTDDVWTDPTEAYDKGSDILMLYFDAMSSEEIGTDTAFLVGIDSTSLTYTTRLMGLRMTSTGLPTGFYLEHYDENLWSWQQMGVSFPAAKMLYGYEADCGRLSPTRTFIEMAIPWERYGGGLDYGINMSGRRFGMTVTYHDRDASGQVPKALSWTGRDPWADDALTVNYWGDMFMTTCAPPPTAAPVVRACTPDPTSDRTPTLSWWPFGDASNYKVVIDTTPAFTAPLVTDYTGGATEYTPSTPLPFDTIFWRISANTDYSNYSATDNFVIFEVVQVPTVVWAPPPTTTDRTPRFEWWPVDGAVRYRVMFTGRTDTGTVTIVDTVDTTVYIPTEPLPLGSYRWHVSSDRDYSRPSSLQVFTIVPLPSPEALTPSEMSTVSPEDTLRWTAVADVEGVVSFRLAVSLSDSLLPDILIDTTLTGTAVCIGDLALDLPESTMVFWQVTAMSTTGAVSAPSATASFILGPSMVLGQLTSGARPAGCVVREAGDGSLAIQYTLTRAAHVRIEVYDLRGNRVAGIVDCTRSPGTYSLVWNGSRTSAARLSSSVLVVRSLVDGIRSTDRVRLTR